MICPFCGKELETWAQQVIRVGSFHEEKQKEFGPGQNGKKEGWGIRNTAREMKMSREKIRQFIIVYAGIKINPQIEKMTSMKSALEFLKRQ